MEVLVGVGLGVATATFTTLAGFERGRVLYPVMLVVIASYYGLFATMGDLHALAAETVAFAVFAAVSVIGFRTNLWIVAAALAGHGVFDVFHGHVIENAGIPAWWPGFCSSIDVTFAAWLAWRLRARAIDARAPASFGVRIKADVDAELRAAAHAEAIGDGEASFRHLERAHVLGQTSTVQHVRTHVAMLAWAVRRRDGREAFGQLTRIVGAASKTALGLVPHGNTGGGNVSPFKPMPVPRDLADRIHTARSAVTSVACLVVLSGAFGLTGCAEAPADMRYAYADGHRVAYRVLGSGRPAIVMIAGLGDGMATFADVAPELARTATVIIYDRAGYGASERAAGVRDAAAAERELVALLAQSGVPAPYVLVGHSLGGLFAEYYAARHPGEIAGLILEESRPADFAQRCAAAGLTMCTPPAAAMKFAPVGAQQEATALSQTSAQVEAAGSASAAPVLVLSRHAKRGAGAFERTWNVEQTRLAARHTAAHRIAPRGGHAIHQDASAWFVAAVRRFPGG